jgi:Tol biopolymer transport system component
MKQLFPVWIISVMIFLMTDPFPLFGAKTDNRTNRKVIPYPKPLPGSTALTFLPGLVSTEAVDFNSAFSPDGNSFYFSRSENGSSKIYVAHHNGTDWTKPVLTSFSTTHYADADPAFAPDGKLYFISNRPGNQSDTLPDYDIWFSEPLTDGSWSAPENLQNVNSDSNEFYVSFSKNGNLYFSSSRKGGFGAEDIYVSKLINGKYALTENLGAAINSSTSEYDPCVSANEDLLIFASSKRNDTYGGADLYASKPDQNKNWYPAYHLPAYINTKSREYCPYITPDANYFFLPAMVI